MPSALVAVIAEIDLAWIDVGIGEHFHAHQVTIGRIEVKPRFDRAVRGHDDVGQGLARGQGRRT